MAVDYNKVSNLQTKWVGKGFKQLEGRIWMQCRVSAGGAREDARQEESFGGQEYGLEVHGDVGEGPLEWRWEILGR